MKLERILHFMVVSLASLSGIPSVRAGRIINGENVLNVSKLMPSLAFIGQEMSDRSDVQECSGQSQLGLSSPSRKPFLDMWRGAAECELRTQPFVEFPWACGGPGCT